jgi:putative ABC transport system permease protein
MPIQRWLQSLVQDLRVGSRNLRRAPGLVAVSVLSLGLGIGLNLTLYSGVVTIFRHQPTMSRPAEVVGIEPGNGRQFSFENYRDLRANGTFRDVVGFRIASMNRRIGNDLARVGVLVVTDNFFDGLGIGAGLGRTFASGEAAPERSPRVAVIDHSYWRTHFGSRADAIGQPLILDGETFTVTGVLPADYRSVTGFMTPSIYVPVSTLTLPTWNDRGSATMSVLARLAPGDTPERAGAAVTALGAELERRYPEMNEGMARPAQVFAAEAMQFRGTPAGFRLLPLVLLGLFGLVLLIGSINVAGLLLARAASRRHELTIRSALGASRRRVVQALFAESAILVVLGTLAGLGLMAVLSAGDWLDMGPIASVFSPDLRLLGPALLLMALTTVLCGAGPALRATRMDLISGLRKGSTGSTDRLHLRHAYVVGQMALSLVLLVVASLCWRSQVQLADADLGFDIEHGIVSRFIVEPTFGSAEARQVFADEVRERIAAIPGVRTAALTGIVPLGGDALVAAFHPAGRTDIPGTRPSTLSVGPEYFQALAIPMVQGRGFDAAHRAGTPAVAIVNQTFARTYFGDNSALGQRIEIGGESDAEIVGVVRDSKIDTIGEAPKSVVYYPFAQRPRRLTVIARTAGDPGATLSAVRSTLTALDATAQVDVSTLREAASTELNMRRVGTRMVGAIGIVGVLLAAIGLYGIMSYLVVSQTGELAIRLALGATSGHLIRQVLRRAIYLLAGGIGIGAVLSLLTTPALVVFLAGVSPADPIAFVAAAVLLVVVAIAASLLPARRVSRIDPLVALRE